MATWDCGEMAARDPGQESHPVCAPGSTSQIIFAWAMDAPELELPPRPAERRGGEERAEPGPRAPMASRPREREHGAPVPRVDAGEEVARGSACTASPGGSASVHRTARSK